MWTPTSTPCSSTLCLKSSMMGRGRMIPIQLKTPKFPMRGDQQIKMTRVPWKWIQFLERKLGKCIHSESVTRVFRKSFSTGKPLFSSKSEVFQPLWQPLFHLASVLLCHFKSVLYSLLNANRGLENLPINRIRKIVKGSLMNRPLAQEPAVPTLGKNPCVKNVQYWKPLFSQNPSVLTLVKETLVTGSECTWRHICTREIFRLFKSSPQKF